MGVAIKKVMAAMEAWAPRDLAESWDNVGLLVGNPNEITEGVLTALDVTEENVRYAIEHQIGLIVAHHPLIFKPLKSLTAGTLQTDLLALLQRHRIAVYAAHTNLDIAAGGVNDNLAALLGLQNVRGLAKTGLAPAYKLAVYVPGTHADVVRKALGDAGAGFVGRYSHCSFAVTGEGRFRPEAGTNPYIGTVGNDELVREERIETIVPQDLLQPVLNAMLAVHPYEEVAYDVYPLHNGGQAHWLGRIGELPQALTLPQALAHIRRALAIPVLRYAGERADKVRTIAFCSGAGMEFWRDALNKGADLYLTGDVKYHEVQEAVAAGLIIADGHHYYTEQHIATAIATYLRKQFADEALRIEEDPLRRDVFQFYIEN